MTITARYPTTCAACGGAIAVGAAIRWRRGAPVRHATCPDRPTGDTPSTASTAETAATASTVETAGRQGQGDDTIVAGRATYRGRPCYLVGRVVRGSTRWDDAVVPVATRDGRRVLCCSRDGARQWWATADDGRATIRIADGAAALGGDVVLVKTYARPRTIGALRRYAEDLRAGKVPTCPNCGSPSCPGRDGDQCDED